MNELPQISAHATNVMAMRMLTKLERATGAGCERTGNVAKDAESGLDGTVRKPYISVT